MGYAISVLVWSELASLRLTKYVCIRGWHCKIFCILYSQERTLLTFHSWVATLIRASLAWKFIKRVAKLLSQLDPNKGFQTRWHTLPGTAASLRRISSYYHSLAEPNVQDRHATRELDKGSHLPQVASNYRPVSRSCVMEYYVMVSQRLWKTSSPSTSGII